MNAKRYVSSALRTLAPVTEEWVKRFREGYQIVHAIFGLLSELGELATEIKKWLIYGKPIDQTNIKEEIGDFFWYLALLCYLFGFDFEEIWELNIAKLKVRYPDKFSEERAINRDLESEEKALNANVGGD